MVSALCALAVTAMLRRSSTCGTASRSSATCTHAAGRETPLYKMAWGRETLEHHVWWDETATPDLRIRARALPPSLCFHHERDPWNPAPTDTSPIARVAAPRT